MLKRGVASDHRSPGWALLKSFGTAFQTTHSHVEHRRKWEFCTMVVLCLWKSWFVNQSVALEAEVPTAWSVLIAAKGKPDIGKSHAYGVRKYRICQARAPTEPRNCSCKTYGTANNESRLLASNLEGG